MKNLLFCIILFFAANAPNLNFCFLSNEFIDGSSIIRAQVPLEGNSVRSFIWNSGVFNQDLRTNNTPGFEFPKNTGKFTIFSTGLTIGAYVNNQLRLSTASYNGEYSPGYCINGVFTTNPTFKLYSVKAGDNQFTNPDYANWGLMVPYGAPYKDVNSNGTFEVETDIPGVKNSQQTVFICMTDADATSHISSEGFSGGTSPLFNEVHMTAWCYLLSGPDYVNFFKWEVINKGTNYWDSTIASIVCDPDIGDGTDDYAGCDTLRSLGFSYNADNVDGDGSGYTYGANPPAMGFMFLSPNPGMMSSFSIFISGTGPSCEKTPQNPSQAYNYMKGYKRDGTPWVNILTEQITRFCFPGDVETAWGWDEYDGKRENCGGLLTGNNQIPSIPGDRRFVMSHKPINQRINPGQSFVIFGSQFSARGDNFKNSVTVVKKLADTVKAFTMREILIGIQPVSNIIPVKFSLEQNYPNPFNPVTGIEFNLPKQGSVKLEVFDVLGQTVSVLVNDMLRAGEYKIQWNASAYPSGVYFYRLQTDDFSETRKMMLVK